MSILNYFSKDANKRAEFMFGTIAPIYAKVDHKLIQAYDKAIAIVDEKVSISGKTVLDIGTGTGAWGMKYVQNKASNVQGIDLSDRIIRSGKLKHPEMLFNIGNAEDMQEFQDESFDIVTASFVVHGVNAARRAKMLKEMKRVSKKYVVLHDFVGKTPAFVRFLEFLEKSDYKNFKKNICTELEDHFSSVEKIQVDHGSGVYIAEK